MKRQRHIIDVAKGLLILAALWLVACNLYAPLEPPPPITGQPPLQPTPTLWHVLPAHQPGPVPRPTLVPDTGWQSLRLGVERRVINRMDAQDRLQDSLYLLRIEPQYYRFNVAYRPGEPQSLEQWQQETGALVIVNGGFFTEAFVATGRIVAAGQASGISYGGFAGMFAVTAAGPELRWLQQQPYDPAEPLLAAIQAFPLLVKPGGELGFAEEDQRPSRRTVVGQDRQGRILFLVSSWPSFSLHQLSLFLANSDLNLDVALNLDGGTSSGLLLADPAEQIPAFAPLPAVITVHEP